MELKLLFQTIWEAHALKGSYYSSQISYVCCLWVNHSMWNCPLIQLHKWLAHAGLDISQSLEETGSSLRATRDEFCCIHPGTGAGAGPQKHLHFHERVFMTASHPGLHTWRHSAVTSWFTLQDLIYDGWYKPTAIRASYLRGSLTAAQKLLGNALWNVYLDKIMFSRQQINFIGILWIHRLDRPCTEQQKHRLAC